MSAASRGRNQGRLGTITPLHLVPTGDYGTVDGQYGRLYRCRQCDETVARTHTHTHQEG